jgi:hypothetical protein
MRREAKIQDKTGVKYDMMDIISIRPFWTPKVHMP